MVGFEYVELFVFVVGIGFVEFIVVIHLENLHIKCLMTVLKEKLVDFSLLKENKWSFFFSFSCYLSREVKLLIYLGKFYFRF